MSWNWLYGPEAGRETPSEIDGSFAESDLAQEGHRLERSCKTIYADHGQN